MKQQPNQEPEEEIEMPEQYEDYKEHELSGNRIPNASEIAAVDESDVPEQQDEPEEPQAINNNDSIKVGEIFLSSKVFNCFDLANLLNALLESKSIKNYLNIKDKTKGESKINYTG